MRNRPNFFIIGAQKSGTTRLHFLLNQHPEVFGSHPKEPCFFSRQFAQPAAVAEYIALFENAHGAKAIGESSTFYSRSQRWPGTARRIFEFNSQARIIYLVRHPLRRMESGWTQARQKTPETPRDFARALRSPALDIVDATLYWKQLSEYRTVFPDQQILLVFFEEFIRDEPATLRRCFEFLGVAPDFPVDCSTQESQNSLASRREPTPLLDSLYHMSILHRLAQKFPAPLKLKIRETLQRPIRSKPLWDAATWSWAIEQIEADTQQLLAHAGQPADFWNWELKPEQKRGDW